jgi:osmotically-inducible protein OsmY
MSLATLKSDLELKREVQRELDWEPRVDATDIRVQVEDGIVTLNGSVSAYAQKVAAREAAHRIVGVLDLVDELQVIILGQQKTDQELAQAVRHALAWSFYVPDREITSTVSNGRVTLEGTVKRGHEREEAVRAVERLSGVRGVTDHITIQFAAVDPAALRTSIEGALARRAQREAERIKIVVANGIVTLEGSVDSWADKNAVERLSLYAPGVKHIVNNILVDPYS